MRLNAMAMAIGLGAALVLTGCNDLSTPKKALATAFKAVKENKLKDLRKALTGRALDVYGNEAGLADLRDQLGPYEISAGKEQLLNVGQDKYGRPNRREVAVTILAREKQKENAEPAEFGEASVTCRIEYEYVACAPDWIEDSWCQDDYHLRGQWCRNPRDHSPSGRREVFCSYDSQPDVRSAQFCKIADLQD